MRASQATETTPARRDAPGATRILPTGLRQAALAASCVAALAFALVCLVGCGSQKPSQEVPRETREAAAQSYARVLGDLDPNRDPYTKDRPNHCYTVSVPMAGQTPFLVVVDFSRDDVMDVSFYHYDATQQRSFELPRAFAMQVGMSPLEATLLQTEDPSRVIYVYDYKDGRPTKAQQVVQGEDAIELEPIGVDDPTVAAALQNTPQVDWVPSTDTKPLLDYAEGKGPEPMDEELRKKIVDAEARGNYVVKGTLKFMTESQMQAFLHDSNPGESWRGMAVFDYDYLILDQPTVWLLRNVRDDGWRVLYVKVVALLAKDDPRDPGRPIPPEDLGKKVYMAFPKPTRHGKAGVCYANDAATPIAQPRAKQFEILGEVK